MPPKEVRSMVLTPTRSEMRLPWSTRLQMSRPNSSVPRMWMALGGLSREAGDSRVGLYEESTPASSAAAMKTSRMSAPVTTLRLPRRRRSQRGRVAGAAAGAVGTRTSTVASVIADARVDERVEEIHAQVDQHIGRGGDEDHALHYRIVAPENGRDDEAAQSRDVEDDLRDDGPADQHSSGDADHGDHGHQRVAERVLPRHHALGQALGPRGADVVLLQHLEHAGAADPRDERRLAEAQRKGGQHHVAEGGHGVREDRHVAGRRQPPEPHREEVDEVEAQPEAGDAHAEERDGHEPAIPGRPAMGGGDGPRGHPDGHRDPEGAQHEDEGGLGALPEGPAHGTVEKVGLAQIAGEHPTVKTDELLPQGAVQAEGLARRLDLRRRGVGPEHDADRITRDQVNEQEDDGRDHGHHGQYREQPSDQIGPHGLRPRSYFSSQTL